MTARLSDPDRDQAARIVALFSVLIHAWQANDFAEAARTTAEMERLGVKVRFRARSKGGKWSAQETAYNLFLLLAFSGALTNPIFVAVATATVAAIVGVLAAKASWKALPVAGARRKGPSVTSLTSTLAASIAMGYFMAENQYQRWLTKSLPQGQLRAIEKNIVAYCNRFSALSAA
jgi:hypothetical protein